jgi:N-acetyl-gamma-glutamyl-phosphate reductase
MVKLRIGIVGASGYSGAELLRILLGHPSVEVTKVFANTSAGKRVDEIYPYFLKRCDLRFEKYSPESAAGLDIVFIALPSGEAPSIVPSLLSVAGKVIDLGGDFRLHDLEEYKRYYKRAHTATEFIPQAVYGLPELYRTAIQSARFVTNPGCYPTAAILGLAPALVEHTISERGIAISSLSGVSGAGRSANVDNLFTEVNENVRAYKVGVHQHAPEIRQTLSHVFGRHVSLTFVPHLIPVNRGIFSSIYAPLNAVVSSEDVIGLYKKFYADAPFVRIVENGTPEIKNVLGTNYCDIGCTVDIENTTLIIFSVIDNLVKGAAGQAVQNMNLMAGLPETTGLL